MALNPPLLPDGRPAGLLGEWYVLERRGIAAHIDTRDPRVGVLKGGCKIMLTTVRIVVLPTKPTPAFSAFDIPLQGLSAEAFKQPIFGANHLDFDVAPVPGRGLESTGPIKVSLTFNEGGCNRLLRVFFALVEKNRAAASAADARARTMLAHPQSFVRELEAFVDPSDPSVIYCVEAPMAPGAAQPPPQPVYAPQPLPPQPGVIYAPAGAVVYGVPPPGGMVMMVPSGPAPPAGMVMAPQQHGPGGAFYAGPAPVVYPPPQAPPGYYAAGAQAYPPPATAPAQGGGYI